MSRPSSAPPSLASSSASSSSSSSSSDFLRIGGAFVGGAVAASAAFLLRRHFSAKYRERQLREAIVVVDPISTGANLAFEISRRNIAVIKLLSGFIAPVLVAMVDPDLAVQFAGEVSYDAKNPESTVAALRALPFNITAILPGSELGVEVADDLSERLGLWYGNTTKLSLARRDKHEMQETIRRNGIRAVRQCRASHWEQVENFLQNEYKNQNEWKIVIKPVKSAGSDNVYLIDNNIEELKERFNFIMENKNQLGFINDACVVQEYLQGKEYVVDSVSRNGIHKVIAIWEYDKRPFNGAPFVYFGMGSVSGHSEIGQALCKYQVQVLDALKIRNGAGHGEVILTSTGPCLVEVGARLHGGEGTFIPMADRCWGYNQVQALTDSVLSVEQFRRYPDVPNHEKEFGFKIDFVCYVDGKVKQVQHLETIRKLPGFLRFDLLPKVGDYVHKTIDCFTEVGTVTFCHTHKDVVMHSVAKVRELEKTMFVV